MDAINSYCSSYVISAMDEDGTLENGFYSYSMVKEERHMPSCDVSCGKPGPCFPYWTQNLHSSS